jgi:tRNA dimethylallyltransferase
MSASRVFENVFILTGPTASGKSAAALALAPGLNAEIVSADSMQVYRGMDIGTAKPSALERALVPHHLIDIRDPWESFSVAEFIRLAEDAIAQIQARRKTALLVGGTPMYIKGFLKGLFRGPAADWALRRELVARADREGVPALHEELRRVDPAAARRIHTNDLRRIVRALEVHAKTGKPISEQQREWQAESPARGGDETLPPGVRGAILVRTRQDICARIDERVERMFREGLVDEVRRLLGRRKGVRHLLCEAPEGPSRQKEPAPFSSAARQALGYKEVIAHLEGQLDLAETIAQVKLRTRQFAKRQMTWFRSFKNFAWIEVGPETPTETILAKIREAFVRA